MARRVPPVSIYRQPSDRCRHNLTSIIPLLCEILDTPSHISSVMTEPSLCVDIEIYFMPSNNGIRKSQIFPRRGTKGKNDRIMIGSVSINLGVVHEEGALVEVSSCPSRCRRCGIDHVHDDGLTHVFSGLVRRQAFGFTLSDGSAHRRISGRQESQENEHERSTRIL